MPFVIQVAGNSDYMYAIFLIVIFVYRVCINVYEGMTAQT